jgi:hypothetical protein
MNFFIKFFKQRIYILILLIIPSCVHYAFPIGYRTRGKPIKKTPPSIDGKEIIMGRHIIPLIEAKINRKARLKKSPFHLRVGLYDSTNYSSLTVKVKDTLINLIEDEIFIYQLHKCENYFKIDISNYSKKDSILIKTNSDSIRLALNSKYPIMRVNLVNNTWSVSYNIYWFKACSVR